VRSRLRCGKRGEAVESGQSARGRLWSKSLRWNGFGPGLTEWKGKAEKEARSGKLSRNGADVPRGTITSGGALRVDYGRFVFHVEQADGAARSVRVAGLRLLLLRKRTHPPPPPVWHTSISDCEGLTGWVHTFSIPRPYRMHTFHALRTGSSQ
jgi:hypothetical protein